MAHRTPSNADEELHLTVPVEFLELPKLVRIKFLLISLLGMKQTVSEEDEFVMDGGRNWMLTTVA
jgi:hypothetical protein